METSEGFLRTTESQYDNALSSIRTPGFRNRNHPPIPKEPEGLLQMPLARKSEALVLGQNDLVTLSPDSRKKRQTVVSQFESDSEASRAEEPRNNVSGRRNGFLEKLKSSSKNIGNFKGSSKLLNSRGSNLLIPKTKDSSKLLTGFKKNDVASETVSNFSDNSESEGTNPIIVGKRKRKRFFCAARNQNRIRWDLFIMLLATWNLFYIPYSVSFEAYLINELVTNITNWLIDFCFILDIFIHFRTSVLDPKTGEDIYDCKIIAAKYFQGKFWIDLLASIPFDFITIFFSGVDSGSLTFQLFGLLKLVRVLRLSRLITYMNLQDELKMSLKLIKLFFFLVMYIHCVGCIWFFIVKQNEKWMPPLDYVWVGTNIYSEDPFLQYCSSIYHSMLILGGNDLGPRGTFQLIFISTVLFGGAIINANIFGNMAVILQQLNKKASKFQEKVENANASMKNLSIPENIKEAVHRYLDYTKTTSDHQEEINKFLSLISPSLKELVVKHISLQGISKNQIFKSRPNIFDQILPELNTLLYTPEDIIVRQGEAPDMIYFISKGECEIYVTDQSNHECHVKNLKVGEYFGEVAILKNCKRTATVKSKNFSTFTGLNKKAFVNVLERYPDIRNDMNKHMTLNYNDKWKKFCKIALSNIDFLQHDLPESIIDEIFYRLELLDVNQGKYLFKDGKTCHNIHIIVSGEGEISIKNVDGEETYLDTLYRGCTVGTYSIMTGDPYSFSFKAKTDCVLLTLSDSSLEDLREKFEDLNLIMSEYEQYIEEEGLPYCDYKFYRSGHSQMTPLKKFQLGIKRIMRIVKSYKSNKLINILQCIQSKNKENLKLQQNKKEEILLRKQSIRSNQTLKSDQKQEKKLTLLSSKINILMRIVDEQTKMMHEMRNDLKTHMGLEKVELDSAAKLSSSSSDFNSDSSMPSQLNISKLRRPPGEQSSNHRRLSAFSNKSHIVNSDKKKNRKKSVMIVEPQDNNKKRGSKFTPHNLKPIINVEAADSGSNSNKTIQNKNAKNKLATDSPSNKDFSVKILGLNEIAQSQDKSPTIPELSEFASHTNTSNLVENLLKSSKENPIDINPSASPTFMKKKDDNELPETNSNGKIDEMISQENQNSDQESSNFKPKKDNSQTEGQQISFNNTLIKEIEKNGMKRLSFQTNFEIENVLKECSSHNSVSDISFDNTNKF
ncbi:unnamed protein product [Moneuplotes crassus]|uniref:Cyclic nucleotide-binding domain-containing protein n=1 Tax=Euplotes crassus TaxID=5936 RepID=A0AAD1X7I4_EUPCR|nr:unnamed protein product [Moneuplotes crassus]